MGNSNLEIRKSGNELGNRDLAERVIGAAIAVHRALGPGFLESIYEQALCIELEELGIPCERQVTVPIRYRDKVVGEHRLDLLVGGALIIELKAVATIEDIHFAVVRSYMNALNPNDALLLNFAAMPLAIRRVGRGWPAANS